jgi:protein-S-isoprenylcysteine O-methyltransferase Ste14
MMKATNFEFANRWWIFGLIFGLSFFLFAVDHQPFGVRLANALISRFHWRELSAEHFVFGVGAGILVLMAIFRTWGSAYLGRDVVHDHALHSNKLQADGPYRHTRNPLYLGNVLMAVGMTVMAPIIGVPIILIGIPLFCYRLIGREEAALEAEQGQPYRDYMRAVPRLWPSLRPRIPATDARPDWINGLAAEAFFWSFALGLLTFAIFLDIRWFYAGFVASPLLSWLAGLALRARTKSSAAAN